MNEELIRQIAQEAANGPHGYAHEIAERAIRLYHARHVAPLVEAVTHMLEPSPPHVPVRDYGQRVASVKQALAAFEEGED